MIKDWKGNNIIPGMHVLVIQTKNPFLMEDMFMGLISADGQYYQLPTVKGKRADEVHSFDIVDEFLAIEDPKGTTGPTSMIFFESKDSLNEIPVSNINFWRPLNEHEIYCIKGVSDNETDYYLHHFS